LTMLKKRRGKSEKQPYIIGFVCNWGAYSAVEMAGVNRSGYPASIKLVRVSCLGRLHLGILLKAFEMGADGVILLGCPEDDCHYESGITKAKEMFVQARQILGLLGIEKQRLELLEVPTGEGDFVAKKLAVFARKINKLGKRAPVKVTDVIPV
jgi:F420-non-reducing hydrogenase iron-sulfur subunit